MIYVKETDKSSLDRSSRSVLDEFADKFKNSELNLNSLKQFIETLQKSTSNIRETLDKQRLVMIEQCGPDTPATEGGQQTLQEIKNALDNVEEDLTDVQQDIDNKLLSFCCI